MTQDSAGTINAKAAGASVVQVETLGRLGLASWGVKYTLHPPHPDPENLEE